MGAMPVLLLLACLPRTSEPPRSAYAWKAPIEAPCPDLAPGLWRYVGEPELVTVVVLGSWTPPDWWAPDAQVDSRAQGRVPGSRLCTLAALPGVDAVEVARVAEVPEVP